MGKESGYFLNLLKKLSYFILFETYFVYFKFL